jgi:hypothetical protein
LPLFALSVSDRLTQLQEERAVRLTDEQVVAHLQKAAEHSANGECEKADAEFQEARLIAKRLVQQPGAALLEKIESKRSESHAAVVERANQEASRLLRSAEWSLRNGDIPGAKKNLAKAMAVPYATQKGPTDEFQNKLDRAITAKRQDAANKDVAKLVAAAKESFGEGHFERAYATVNAAMAVKDATDTAGAEQLLRAIIDAQPELLFDGAQQAVGRGEYSVAAQRLRDFLASPYAWKKPEAAKLFALLEIVLDGSKAQATLRSMTDREFKSFLDGWVLPDGLTVAGNTGLTRAVKEALRTEVSQERDRRHAQLAHPEATTPETAANSGSSEPIPADVTYEIISENTDDPFYKRGVKRTIDVRINRKVSEDVLRSIAVRIKNSDRKDYERTFICYFLPGMKADGSHACWASTHFTPNLVVQINEWAEWIQPDK